MSRSLSAGRMSAGIARRWRFMARMLPQRLRRHVVGSARDADASGKCVRLRTKQGNVSAAKVIIFLFEPLLVVVTAVFARNKSQSERYYDKGDAHQHEGVIARFGAPGPDRDRDHEDRELELVDGSHGFSFGANR